ncbi:MAG: molybdenum cofactor cytidylyltransferase, partial [Parasphingorhabdus sp.]
MNKSCLILAAGSSSRFGSQKLLQSMPDGKPMLLATIARYSQLFQHIVVVIPTGNHAMKILLKNQSVDIVECEQSVQGMG